MPAESDYKHLIDPLSVFPALLTNPLIGNGEVELIASGTDYHLTFYVLIGRLPSLEEASEYVNCQREISDLATDELVLGVAVSLKTNKKSYAVEYGTTGVGIWEKINPEDKILRLGPTIHMINAGNQ